jgi:hypothetical protein
MAAVKNGLRWADTVSLRSRGVLPAPPEDDHSVSAISFMASGVDVEDHVLRR